MRHEQRQRRKQQKQKRKSTEQKKDARRVERRQQYPRFVCDSANGDPEFVQAVRTALRTVDFDGFPPTERDFYKSVREHGVMTAFGLLNDRMRLAGMDTQEQNHVRLALSLNLGTRLLEAVPEETRRRLMPYNDVYVNFQSRNILLQFSSLLKEKGAGGTVYFSRRRPKVKCDGQEYTIAFSRHVIERICERINPRYIQYAAAGDVHAFFANCVYFEPIVLHDGQHAAVLYNLCGDPPFVSHHVYVEQVLGKENVDPKKGTCYYRVGYLPVVLENGFAKAKTVLFPGYTGTPEHGAILQSRLSRQEKDRMIEAARKLDADEVLIKQNHELIKWFHNNGVPQAVQMTRRVFADPLTPFLKST